MVNVGRARAINVFGMASQQSALDYLEQAAGDR
jgi:hypothetical protein